jgi:peptidoglycan/xylan/chitin deacetylase (PgdA/CDA1 family)
VFRRQVDAMLAAGWSVHPLAAVANWIREDVGFPSCPASITFDDAYESVFTEAFPILEKAGLKATVFPVTGFFGETNRWAPLGQGPLRIMTSAQLKELSEAGWEIGSHTHSHRSLPALSDGELRSELLTSRSVLENLIGRAVRVMAYPYGHHDRRARWIAGGLHDVCVTIGAAKTSGRCRLDAVPRIDAWYLRKPWQIRNLHGRTGALYLSSRRSARFLGKRWREDAHIFS